MPTDTPTNKVPTTFIKFRTLEDAVANLYWRDKVNLIIQTTTPAEPAPVPDTYETESDPDTLRAQRDVWQEQAEATGIRLDATTRDLARWETSCRAKVEEIDNLREEIDNLWADNAHLTEWLHAHWHEAAAEVTELREEVKRLTEQRDDAQQETEKRIRQTKMVRVGELHFQNRWEEADTNLRKVVEERDALATKVTNLRDEVKRLTEQLDTAQGCYTDNAILIKQRDALNAGLLAHTEFTRNVATTLGVGTSVISLQEVLQKIKDLQAQLLSAKATGYRNLIVEVDTIQEGDEVWEFGRGPWGPVSTIEHGQAYRFGHNKMRRRVTRA
jgi:DNA repair exonuclease SbcCD ATPase subunit